MAADFALDLTQDGVTLLHRTQAGWEPMGEARLDASDFEERVTWLSRQAAAISGPVVPSRILLPDSQVLYLSVTASGLDTVADENRIRTALHGATPYAVDDLVFDWFESAGRLHVAVVARETLAEAAEFARQRGFTPVEVSARENPEFGREPEFAFATASGEPRGAVPPDPEPPRAEQTDIEPPETEPLNAEQPNSEQSSSAPPSSEAAAAPTPPATPSDDRVDPPVGAGTPLPTVDVPPEQPPHSEPEIADASVVRAGIEPAHSEPAPKSETRDPVEAEPESPADEATAEAPTKGKGRGRKKAGAAGKNGAAAGKKGGLVRRRRGKAAKPAVSAEPPVVSEPKIADPIDTPLPVPDAAPSNPAPSNPATPAWDNDSPSPDGASPAKDEAPEPIPTFASIRARLAAANGPDIGTDMPLRAPVAPPVAKEPALPEAPPMAADSKPPKVKTPQVKTAPTLGPATPKVSAVPPAPAVPAAAAASLSPDLSVAAGPSAAEKETTSPGRGLLGLAGRLGRRRAEPEGTAPPPTVEPPAPPNAAVRKKNGADVSAEPPLRNGALSATPPSAKTLANGHAFGEDTEQPAPMLEPAPPEESGSVPARMQALRSRLSRDATASEDLDAAPEPAAKAPARAKRGRRKAAVAPAVEPEAPKRKRIEPVRRADLAGAIPAPSGVAPSKTPGLSEAETMTVFGARRVQQERVTGAGGRYLGLVLTLALVAMLGLAGLWSLWFQSGTTQPEPLSPSIAALPPTPLPQGTETPPTETTSGLLISPTEATPGAIRPTDPVALPTPEPQPQPAEPTPAPEPTELVQPQAPIPTPEPAAEGSVPVATAEAEVTEAAPDAQLALVSPSPDPLPDPQAPAPADPGPIAAPAPETPTLPRVTSEPAPNDPLAAVPDLPDGPLERALVEAIHARTGIWQQTPNGRLQPPDDRLADLGLSDGQSRRPEGAPFDLPDQADRVDDVLPPQAAPRRAESPAIYGPGGRVRATPEGALSPDGILIYARRPDIVPPRRIVGPDGLPRAEPAVPVDPLEGFRPRRRPDDLTLVPVVIPGSPTELALVPQVSAADPLPAALGENSAQAPNPQVSLADPSIASAVAPVSDTSDAAISAEPRVTVEAAAALSRALIEPAPSTDSSATVSVTEPLVTLPTESALLGPTQADRASTPDGDRVALAVPSLATPAAPSTTAVESGAAPLIVPGIEVQPTALVPEEEPPLASVGPVDSDIPSPSAGPDPAPTAVSEAPDLPIRATARPRAAPRADVQLAALAVPEPEPPLATSDSSDADLGDAAPVLTEPTRRPRRRPPSAFVAVEESTAETDTQETRDLAALTETTQGPRPSRRPASPDAAEIAALTEVALAEALAPVRSSSPSAVDTTIRPRRAPRVQLASLPIPDAALPTPSAVAPAAPVFPGATDLAVATVPKPRLKPANISQIADRARRRAEAEVAAAAAARATAQRPTQTTAAQPAATQQPRRQAEPAPAPATRTTRQTQRSEPSGDVVTSSRRGPPVARSERVSPRVPSSASVARQATIRNAVALNKAALIGVFGTPNNRRALVRLPSGKVVKVKVGDRIDNGRVSRITESELRYTRRGQNVTLKMPRG